MKKILLVILFTLIISNISAQNNSPAHYFPLSIGNHWTYEAIFDTTVPNSERWLYIDVLDTTTFGIPGETVSYKVQYSEQLFYEPDTHIYRITYYSFNPNGDLGYTAFFVDGNLLVLDQKYGSNYSVLPGNIGGYGWAQDQSCFHNAVYLNQWHPIFSGQTRQVIDCKVDGYLNQYPNNAKILLKRTINDMPALISYPYGAGNITVTTTYPDWGYGHNQVSQEELKLVRDLTTYAMNPDMPVPEFYPDSSVSVPVKICYSNYDSLSAKKAIIKVYNPDRELYDSLNVAINLKYGEDTEFVWNHSPLPESLGLWTINYALLDSNNQYIQKYIPTYDHFPMQVTTLKRLLQV